MESKHLTLKQLTELSRILLTKGSKDLQDVMVEIGDPSLPESALSGKFIKEVSEALGRDLHCLGLSNTELKKLVSMLPELKNDPEIDRQLNPPEALQSALARYPLLAKIAAE